MSTMKTQNTHTKNTRKNNAQKALEAFCHHVAGANEMTTLIARHLDDHMEVEASKVTWANAGDAQHAHAKLRELAAFLNLI